MCIFIKCWKPVWYFDVFFPRCWVLLDIIDHLSEIYLFSLWYYLIFILIHAEIYVFSQNTLKKSLFYIRKPFDDIVKFNVNCYWLLQSTMQCLQHEFPLWIEQFAPPHSQKVFRRQNQHSIFYSSSIYLPVDEGLRHLAIHLADLLLLLQAEQWSHVEELDWFWKGFDSKWLQ